MLTSEQFLKHLRDALNHLYDPDRLRRSPLVALFDVADRFDAPSALQRILTKAIESLEPQADEPSRAHGRQVYDLLLYRYVQQFSQQEVASQLGISVRHLRREQRAALEALAYHLWEQFALEEKLREGAHVEGAATRVEAVSPTISEEVAWLKDTAPDKHTDLNQTLLAVLGLARPLAVQHGVRLEIKVADNLPALAVHPVAVRQTFLNLLTVAIHRASGGRVVVSAEPLRWEVESQVRARPGRGVKISSGSAPDPREEGASLDMARQLSELCGGRLTLTPDGEPFTATLVLPALEQLPVLVIDDNADTIQLMRRYASDTRYRLLGARNLEQALSLAGKFSPQIVVLDVMMPEVDGWEALGRLRQHPLTNHIPVIVCTILAQEELALSLGASGFVRKPITRQALLAALDHQAALMGPESC